MTSPDETAVQPHIDDLCFRLHQAATLVDRLVDTWLREHWALPAGQFWTLVAVGLREESPSQREIARELGVSRAAVTARVRALSSAGLVTVHHAPGDRRTQRVALTERGARRLAEAWQGLVAYQNTLLSDIDQHALGTRIDLLVDNAESAERARAATRG
jgi:DNA-binding MarR family transcriptional regulator